MAAELAITVEQGASWTRVCALQNAGATAYDLTGCTIEAQARGEFNLGATPEAQFVVTYAASRATGLFRLSLSWETTADQSFRKIMYWDILLTDADGTKIRLIEGGVEVTAATTIPDDETAEPTPATPSGSDTVDITIVLTSPISATVGTAIVTDPTAIHYPSGSASMTTARLIGRYTTGSGLAQEITVGSGLVLNSSTGVLTSSGGGGSGDVTLDGDNVYLVGGSNAFASATNSFGSLNLDATASTLYGPDGRGIIPVAGETWLSGTSAYWNLFTDTVTGGASGTLNLATQKFSEGWGVSAAALPTFLFTLSGTSPLTTTFGMRENTDDIFWGGTQIMPNMYYSGSSLTRRDNTKSGAMFQLENYYCQNGGAVAAAGVDTTGDFFQFTDVTGSAGPVNFYPCTLNVVSGGLPSGLAVSTPYWFFAVNSTATTQTSGTLTTGAVYEITTYVAGDNFTNVGAASNASGVKFVATGTTPTTYTNGSTVTKLKAFRLGSSRANAVAGTAVNVTTQGTGSFIAAFRVNEINWTTQTASGQETRLINFVAPASDYSLGANLNLLLPVTQSIPRTSLDAEPSFIVQHDHISTDDIPTTLQINGYDSLGVGSASRLRMNGSHADFSFWSGVNSGENVGFNTFGLRDGNAGAWRMWLDSTGNIGIGNTSPATKLHVTGTVTATDFAGSGASLTSVNAATVTTAGINSVGYIPMFAATGSANQSVLMNDGLFVENPTGFRILNLGEGFGRGAPYESTGRIKLWHKLSTFHTQLYAANATADRAIDLPDADGSLALLTDITGGSRAGSFTTLAASGAGSSTYNQAASLSAYLASGTLLGNGSGASGTASLPMIFHQPSAATAHTNWSTGANNGTVFGCNEVAGFTGAFFDFREGSGTFAAPRAALINTTSGGTTDFRLYGSSTSNFGLIRGSGNGSLQFGIASTIVAGVSTSAVVLNRDMCLHWSTSTTNPGTTNDTTLSRISAGLIGFGTGAQAEIDGSWSALNGTLGGTLAVTGATTLTGNLTSNGAYISTPQALSGNGAVAAVSVATEVTTIANTGTANTTTTLAAGTNGQRKIISFITDGGFDAVVTVTNPAWGGAGTITMNDALDNIMLIYLNSVWQVFINNGCTLA